MYYTHLYPICETYQLNDTIRKDTTKNCAASGGPRGPLLETEPLLDFGADVWGGAQLEERQGLLVPSGILGFRVQGLRFRAWGLGFRV